MSKLIDLSGQRFGRLTVIERAGTANDGHVMWACKCDCGKETVVSSHSLRNGVQKSCGCFRSEAVSNAVSKHRGSGERLYKLWKRIKQRCNDHNIAQWADYGGRGIRMCEEWETDYSVFREWALANGYDETAKRGNCTIDRIDVNGNYCPENCRWVSMDAQNANKRNTVFLEFNNEVHSLVEWSKITGIPRAIITKRLWRGWTVERALTQPIK